MDLNGMKSLDFTVLICRDMENTCFFYRGIMRLHLEIDRENWKSFRVGATLLTLRPRGKWAVCDDGDLPMGTAPVQLAFRVAPSAIEEWHAKLVEHGVEILRGPTEIQDWRHNTLFFKDPEGNILELYAEL